MLVIVSLVVILVIKSLSLIVKYVILYPNMFPLRSDSGGGSHDINKLVDDKFTPITFKGIALGATGNEILQCHNNYLGTKLLTCFTGSKINSCFWS